MGLLRSKPLVSSAVVSLCCVLEPCMYGCTSLFACKLLKGRASVPVKPQTRCGTKCPASGCGRSALCTGPGPGRQNTLEDCQPFLGVSDLTTPRPEAWKDGITSWLGWENDSESPSRRDPDSRLGAQLLKLSEAGWAGPEASQNNPPGTFLVAEWKRICLTMQGTWFRPLIREDPTCHTAAKPGHHNY